MTDIKKLEELALTLGIRLKKQTDKWINTFFQEHYKFSQIQEAKESNIQAALKVVTAFQVVHTISFLHVRKYIEENEKATFANKLIEALYGPPDEDWIKYLDQYQSNKKMNLSQQLVRFCEDYSMAITGSYSGMISGPAFTVMAKELIIRNWGIIADHFTDTKTMEKCIKAVEAIHQEST